jgi:hypothetical protein
MLRTRYHTVRKKICYVQHVEEPEPVLFYFRIGYGYRNKLCFKSRTYT